MTNAHTKFTEELAYVIATHEIGYELGRIILKLYADAAADQNDDEAAALMRELEPLYRSEMGRHEQQRMFEPEPGA